VTASTNAGRDSTGTVCITNNAVILQPYLYNAQTGGTWKDIDNSGSLSNGVFNATKVTPGSYQFRYVILSAQCGNDSATITINVVSVPNAGNDTSVSVCGTSTSYDLLTHLGGTPETGGSWTDVNGSHELTNNIFNPSKVMAGSFSFRYKVTLSACGSDSSTITVNVISAANAGLDSSGIYCNSQTAVILSSYLRGAEPGGTWIDLSGSGALNGNVFNPSAGVPGINRLAYIVTTSGTCVSSDTAFMTITVTQGPSDTMTVSSDHVCLGAQVVIKVMNAEAGVTYTLEDSATLSAASPSVDSTGNIQLPLFASDATVGTHTYLVNASRGGCKVLLAQYSQVVISAAPNPSITGAPTVCPIDSGVQYNATAQNNCRYLWSLVPSLSATIGTYAGNQVLVNFNGTSGNTLYVIVTDSISLCHNSDSLQITASDSVVPVIVCAKDIPVTANITSIVDNVYQYAVASNELQPISVKDNCGTVVLQNNYNNTDSIKAGTNILISVAGSGNNFEKTILWTVVNEGQKEATCEVSINVTINDKLQPMSAFSPNGDGVNENWIITNIERYPDATVQVFNRWGELVFESKSNYNNDWDGSNLPVDSYHYIITQNGKMLCRGIVTIIR
jgi:gliding motility-associated-like protein